MDCLSSAEHCKQLAELAGRTLTTTETRQQKLAMTAMTMVTTASQRVQTTAVRVKRLTLLQRCDRVCVRVCCFDGGVKRRAKGSGGGVSRKVTARGTLTFSCATYTKWAIFTRVVL